MRCNKAGIGPSSSSSHPSHHGRASFLCAAHEMSLLAVGGCSAQLARAAQLDAGSQPLTRTTQTNKLADNQRRRRREPSRVEKVATETSAGCRRQESAQVALTQQKPLDDVSLSSRRSEPAHCSLVDANVAARPAPVRSHDVPPLSLSKPLRTQSPTSERTSERATWKEITNCALGQKLMMMITIMARWRGSLFVVSKFHVRADIDSARRRAAWFDGGRGDSIV
jgi:hypothetical protein